MITENQFIKDNYLNFHKKPSDELFKIDDILINKFIDEDGSYNTMSIYNKLSEYIYENDNLTYITSTHPIIDEDDNELLLSTHQFNVYNNDNIFTSIISQTISDDEDDIVDTHEYSINYSYNNHLLAFKHYSSDFQESYKYDKHENIIKISNDDSITKFTYNKHNKISTRTIGNESTIYNYDKNNNLIHLSKSKKNKIIHELSYIYTNNILTEIHSNGYDCLFSYNKDGLIDSISESLADGSHNHVNIKYDKNNHFNHVKYSNGDEEFYTFNDDNILLKFSTNDGIIFENDDLLLTIDKSKTIIHSHSIH